uniref:Uncharacterized protein n=1 Tax=Micrurus lemniscatus lemniscatus TaxID=129467 RepID=A0A2D4HAG4_MICLE
MEKQPAISNANIHSTVLTLQDSISKLQEIMLKNHTETKADINELKEEMGKLKGEMKADISKLDEKIGTIQQALEKNELTIKEVEKRAEQTEKNLERVDEHLKTVIKEMEDSLVYLEMDKAATYLRFHNIVESKEEDLEQVMAEILAEVLERRDFERVGRSLQSIY